MSDAQIKMLFGKLKELTDELASMKEMVKKSVANSELVVSGYQSHGNEIENLRKSMDKLTLNCPLVKGVS